MEIPKTLWLKHNMKPELFARCQFFDLPDFLTYRATGNNLRSTCSLTCKCSYVPNSGWQPQFFEKIGLGEFVQNDYKQLGGANGNVATAGLPVGSGLSKKAAEELGLLEGTPVGSAVIDAYDSVFIPPVRFQANSEQIRRVARHRRGKVQRKRYIVRLCSLPR